MANVERTRCDNLNSFLIECQNSVKAIEKYSGADPLDLWYRYLLRIDEHFVIDFKQETIFDLILSACLCTFEQDERYKQDRRLIKLFIKFIHFQEEQELHYETMLANGIGNTVADLYINWAFYFDMKGDFKKADQIFRRGKNAKAMPTDLLQTAHQDFGYSLSQRMLHKSNEAFDRMQVQLERISALRMDGLSSKVAKSMNLHTFDKAALVNVCIPFYNKPSLTAEPQHNTSITQNIMDSARKMRRQRNQSGNVTKCRLDFTDGVFETVPHPVNENLYEKGIKVGQNYPRKSLPQPVYPTRAYVDPDIDTYRKTLPAYDKIMLVPATNVAFSPEELTAYKWFKERRINNAFTTEQDKIWSVGYDVPIRWADVFARRNFPQSEWMVPRISSSEFFNENGPHKFMCNMLELYPEDSNEEYQLEEIIWKKRKLTDQKSASTQPNKSLLKSSRIHNRSNSFDSKLSPIIEMDLSGHEVALTETPHKNESIHLNATVAEPKKRKSSMYRNFDALNDTCTTQMFSNLLHSSAFSTPKVKMPKIHEDLACDNLPEETKLKLFIDHSTFDPMADGNLVQRDANQNDVVSHPSNDLKFAIYEDPTMVAREMMGMLGKNVINDSVSGNKENVFLERSKLSDAQNKTQIKGCEANVTISHGQKKEEIIAIDGKSETRNTQNCVAPQSNGFAFDIYTDKTNENLKVIKFLEDSRQILGYSQTSINNKENICEYKTENENQNTMESNEKETPMVNEMSTSNLNATKKGASLVNDQFAFKEPTMMNLSTNKNNFTIKSNQTTFFELLDTTEEFEAIEAQCAESPPEPQPSNTPIKRIDQMFTRIRTPNRSNTMNKTAIKDTMLKWTLERAMAKPKESSAVVRGEIENKESDNEMDDDDDIGKSIYVKQPELEFNEKDADWNEVTQFLTDEAATNEYKSEEIKLNETRQRIDTHMLNLKDLNPFDPEVQKDVLIDLGFLDQLNGANNFNCVLMNIVHPLKPRSSIEINQRKYQVRKLIGTGAFGKVFSAECTKTKEMFALKQQRPPNLWEYYVCLQIHTRIKDKFIRKGFMVVDFAIIGNNATIYASKFSNHGTILNVLNKVKQATDKSIEECIVMILVKQMFTIIEHLHKANFIHADIKPDNFLLMDKLSLNYENPDLALQLIDFGQSIDLNYFSNHVFWAKVNTDNFVCTEMMENKPWTFHCDLFCLASTIYTMVAGKYMVVSRRKPTDPYKPQKLPRYVNATLWNEIFDTLINIPSLKKEKMPSLRRLQGLLDAELANIGPKKITDAIIKFNKALD